MSLIFRGRSNWEAFTYKFLKFSKPEMDDGIGASRPLPCISLVVSDKLTKNNQEGLKWKTQIWYFHLEISLELRISYSLSSLLQFWMKSGILPFKLLSFILLHLICNMLISQENIFPPQPPPPPNFFWINLTSMINLNSIEKLTSLLNSSDQQVLMANCHSICWRTIFCKTKHVKSFKDYKRHLKTAKLMLFLFMSVEGIWSSRKEKQNISLEMSYKVSKLTNFPNSGGTCPEKLFTSRSL